MPDEKETQESTDSKSKKPQSKKPSPPNVLIVFKVKKESTWAVYPRLFNNEETALTKLEQSYPFEEYFFQALDLP